MMSYPHRKNADGTVDSICPECFRTVATVWSEWELAEAERAHRCDVGRMAELRRDRAFCAGPSFPAVAGAKIRVPVRDAA
jgi:hypothetical protein